MTIENIDYKCSGCGHDCQAIVFPPGQMTMGVEPGEHFNCPACGKHLSVGMQSCIGEDGEDCPLSYVE